MVYELTGFPVVIEDPQGNLLASAAPWSPGHSDQAHDRQQELASSPASILRPSGWRPTRSGVRPHWGAIRRARAP